MPITTIQIPEYECIHCGYKWINRVNGIDGPIPKNCARCKRRHWINDDEKNKNSYELITPKERGLRRRIKGFNNLYYYDALIIKQLQDRIDWPMDLCERFLKIVPRPTIQEMVEVINASPLRRYNNGADVSRTRNKIPHPDKPGDLKYDESSWIPDPEKPGKLKWNDDPNFVSDHAKAIIEEARKRKDLMEKIIRMRENK
jgi:hypothetical protein